MMSNDPFHRHQRRPAPYWRLAGWAAAIIALLLVFGAYQQPEMMMQMAQQLWSCF